MKLSCYIVDDEPLAIEVLEAHVDKVDQLRIAGSFQNAVKAFEALQDEEVDLLFLDIQMPRLTGIDLLKTLKRPPHVIFTTAYREYALEGFELDVVDYLLKPISFERFLRAIHKVCSLERSSRPAPPAAGESPDAEPSLFVQVDKKMVRLGLDRIRYLESQRDYVKIVTDEKEILAHQTLAYMEDSLPPDRFLRIHRSFIVALDRIEGWSSSEIDLPDRTLSIGRTYKSQVISRLEEHSSIL